MKDILVVVLGHTGYYFFGSLPNMKNVIAKIVKFIFNIEPYTAANFNMLLFLQYVDIQWLPSRDGGNTFNTGYYCDYAGHTFLAIFRVFKL